MSQYKAIPNVEMIIPCTLKNRAEDQYPQCLLYDSSGALTNTINLTHIANGHYQGTVTLTGGNKHLAGLISTYSDAARTSLNEIYETIDISVFVDETFRYQVGLGKQAIGEDDIERIIDTIKKYFDKKIESENKKLQEYYEAKETVIKNEITAELSKYLKEINGQINVIAREPQEDIKKYFNQLDHKLSSFQKTNIDNLVRQVAKIKPPIVDDKEIKQIAEKINYRLLESDEKSLQIMAKEIKKSAESNTLNTAQNYKAYQLALSELSSRLNLMFKNINDNNKQAEKMLEALNKEEAKRILMLAELLKGGLKDIYFTNLFHKLKTQNE